MNAEFESKAYRAAFVEESVKTSVAFQVRSLREHMELNQKQLGALAGKRQSVISRLENPDYGKYNISTLIDLACAFDVGLLVRFVSFSDLAKSLENVSPEALAVPNYTEEKQRAKTRAAESITGGSALRAAPKG